MKCWNRQDEGRAQKQNRDLRLSTEHTVLAPQSLQAMLQGCERSNKMEEDENKTGVQGKFPSDPNSDNQNVKQKNVSCFTRVVPEL